MKCHKFFILSVLMIISACKEQNNIVLQSPETMDFASMVYPALDTENSIWFFFSSASRPFGMVNLSPDTEIEGAWGSGYLYKTDTIKGFSHIHGWQISGVSLMPVTLSNENENDIFSDFYSKFKHDKETIIPGYHRLELERYNIKSELTSTSRVGFQRYTYPKDIPSSWVMIDLQIPAEHSYNIKEATLQKIKDYRIEGYSHQNSTN